MEDKSKHLLGWISDRNASLIGLTVGILGFILSIYFFYLSLNSPKLTFTVDPNRTAIVRTGIASSIEVFVNNKPHLGNITATRVIIWNAGNKEIRPEDIIEPVEFQLSKGSKILEVRVTKARRKSTKFVAFYDKNSSNKFALFFDIIEPGNAAEVTIIHEGLEDVELVAQGFILEQGIIEISEDKNIKFQSFLAQYLGGENETSFISQAITGYWLAILALIASIVLLMSIYSMARKVYLQKQKPKMSSLIGLMFLAATCVTSGYYAKMLLSQSIPPNF